MKKLIVSMLILLASTYAQAGFLTGYLLGSWYGSGRTSEYRTPCKDPSVLNPQEKVVCQEKEDSKRHATWGLGISLTLLVTMYLAAILYDIKLYKEARAKMTPEELAQDDLLRSDPYC